MLNAIAAALAAALAGEGFDGGDFDGMNRNDFEHAAQWVAAEIQRRNAEKAASIKATRLIKKRAGHA